MTDSTSNQLLVALQTQYTNFINNLASQRVKGVIISGEAIEVQLLYSAVANVWSINILHIKTGLAVSDSYSSYANALAVYNNIT